MELRNGGDRLSAYDRDVARWTCWNSRRSCSTGLTPLHTGVLAMSLSVWIGLGVLTVVLLTSLFGIAVSIACSGLEEHETEPWGRRR